MKTLPGHDPTDQQLVVLRNTNAGVSLIRGAAGSGKTTTAILKIRHLIPYLNSRRRSGHATSEDRILVLTFNRTLRGYIENLVFAQVREFGDTSVEVETFSGWALSMLDLDDDLLLSLGEIKMKLHGLARDSALSSDIDFLVEEAQYALGRFLPATLNSYLGCKRVGRGRSPRCDLSLRQGIIEKIIRPYSAWKAGGSRWDYNDLAVALAVEPRPYKYPIVVVDEAQDFTANEVRALLSHLADPHVMICVLDGAQRIYPRGFHWKDLGIEISPQNVHRLHVNYRNTIEIAGFARPLLENVDIGEDDGTLPDLDSCQRSGPRPVVLLGRYSRQLEWVYANLLRKINLEEETLCFLHPKGGGWFGATRTFLQSKGLEWVELSRQREWPDSPTNIGLSTMSSAKGLEFDHVVILGLNDDVMPHQSEDGHLTLDQQCRLLAVACTRARRSLTVGYKPSEASRLVSRFAPDTFVEYRL